MKRKSAWLSFAACALMAAHPAKAAQEKTAPVAKAPAPQPADFSNVQVITFADNNSIGFFDRITGILYVYDSSLTKCVTVKKLVALGESAKVIKG